MADCPVHALWDQMWLLRRRFGARFRNDVPDHSLPLFPCSSGGAASKHSVVATILSAAQRLQLPLVSPDASFRVSGHSLRATGAQSLTRMGLDLWAVQVLGRWGSATVTRYIRESSASADAALSRRHVLGQSLRALTLDLRSRAQAPAAVCPDLVRSCIKDLLPDFAAGLRDSLSEAVVAEVARQRAASQASKPSSSSSSSEPASPAAAPAPPPPPALDRDFVTSSWSRKRHIVALGPKTTVERWLWITACGWKFGQTSGARDAMDGDSLCPRCFCSARA